MNGEATEAMQDLTGAPAETFHFNKITVRIRTRSPTNANIADAHAHRAEQLSDVSSFSFDCSRSEKSLLTVPCGPSCSNGKPRVR